VHGGDLAYATVLNHLKALWLKRLVHIAHGERGNTYAATCSCDQFMQQVLAELIARFFAGEPDKLVAYVQARRIALSEPPESLIPLDLRIVQ
jgi:predicted transcriptional regulator